jgi:hypothetical protein
MAMVLRLIEQYLGAPKDPAAIRQSRERHVLYSAVTSVRPNGEDAALVAFSYKPHVNDIFASKFPNAEIQPAPTQLSSDKAYCLENFGSAVLRGDEKQQFMDEYAQFQKAEPPLVGLR